MGFIMVHLYLLCSYPPMSPLGPPASLLPSLSSSKPGWLQPHCVAQVGLELRFLVPPSPKCWVLKCGPLGLACYSLIKL